MKKQKGFALAFTLFALVILATLGLGMLVVMLSSSKGSFAYRNNTDALNYATAGIERALVELQGSTTWTGPDTEDIGSGYFTMQVINTNTTSSLLQWEVQSTGYSGGAARTITAILSQVSFAQFGYFSNNENLPNEPNQEWWIGGNVVEGPMGTNGNFLFYDHPAFTSKVTSANGCYAGENCGNDPSYDDPYYSYNNREYTQQNPPNPYNPDYFYHYYSGYSNDDPEAYNGSGAFSFAGGQQYVPWPTINVQTMQTEANEVYSGDTKITLNSNGTATVVTGGSIQYTAGQQMTYTGGSTTTYTIPNTGGLIYVENGNVMLSGTLNGRLTIATGPAAAGSGGNTWPTTAPTACQTIPSTNGAPPNCGNVDIEGNLTYSGKSVCDGSNNSTCNTYTGTSSLGVVATGDVNVDPYSTTGGNEEVDGSLLAMPQTFTSTTGQTTTTTTVHTGVGVVGYNYSCDNIVTNGVDDGGAGCTGNFCSVCPPAEGTYPTTGNFFMFGGMIPELGGDPVGEFNPGNDTIVSGYNQVFYYDTRMATNPPPDFPITGTIQIIQWEDSDAL